MIDFSKESIAEIMGLSSIIFNVGDGKSDAIGLHIYLNESSFGLTGKMEQDGSIVWNFNEDLVEDGAVLLLQYIVSTAFRDLVKYGGIKDIERSGKYVHPIVHADHELKDPAKKKRSRNRHRSAPRFKVHSRETAPVGLQASSADVIETIELDAKKHHIEFSPRHVDPFKRNFTNLEAYREAARAYREASEDDKPSLLEALKTVRSMIRQPSIDKIASMQDLPERFKPRPLTDPVTGDHLRDVKPGREGLLMWCATWVKAHISPKATQEEMNSMSVRYRKWYRQASAQAFDSDIKNWIFGLDMSEADAAETE
jgi:hypothetical protein